MRRPYLAFILILSLSVSAAAQSVASGTIEGTITDPQGAVIAGATVSIRNPISGYQQTTTTDASGTFRFSNVPFNNYHIEVTQSGFATGQHDVNVRSLVPVSVKLALVVGNVSETVSVEATSADLVETAPYAHVDVDISTLAKLPTLSPASGLSDAIVLSSPGVVADSNGFFHPIGDHAQTSFSIDGQPISDQQSKAFSTQIPVNAIQSMELVTGTPNAEFGDKTSLVVNATTRSGLGLTRPTGSFLTQYGSFGTISEEADLGFGGPKSGFFLAANGLRSGRFLDTPEFRPIHAIGNSGNIFNRIDFNPSNSDVLHLNIFVARNSFQVPNTLDQPDQDQRQKVVTINIAPGYQHTFSTHSLLTINPFVRRDSVNFNPSADPFNDSPATLSQHRTLTNYGVRADVSYANARHNLKIGAQLMSTRLNENFSLGITDSLFSLPGLLPLDLTRGGTLFNFADKGNVNQYAAYIQDAVTIGKLTLNPGLRVDRYDGVGVQDTLAEPRIGVSVLAGGGTVLRAGYARTMETPYNENLLVATSPDATDLIEAFSEEGLAPLKTGRRNQYNLGVSQGISKYFSVDGEYFWKFTNNAYDFGVLFNTPVAFPITWPKSKIDGVSFRLSTANLKGFQWYTTMGHNKARFFPEDGSVFRIDHDQNFQETTNFRYQWKRNGPWAAFTWRYDSGLVAGAVASLDDALALSPAEQSAIGFSCGNQKATPDAGIDSCSGSFGTTRLRIPDDPNDDHNPPRIAPRHILDFGIGTENLLRRNEGTRISLRLTVSNLANTVALYNFQSTFSGTHFVAPRSYEGAIGFTF